MLIRRCTQNCEYNCRDEEIKVKKVKLSLKHFTMKTDGGSGCIDPRILDIGTTWR
jgi:hypothetical protein